MSKKGKVSKKKTPAQKGPVGSSTQPSKLDQALQSAINYFKSGDLENSLKYLDEVIRKSSPEYPYLHLANFYKGRIYQKKGDDEKAEKFYRDSIKVNSNFEIVHNNLANILKGKGQYEEAQHEYEWAIRLKPEYYDAYYNMANLFIETEKLDIAKKLLERVLAINPNYTLAKDLMEKLAHVGGSIDELNEQIKKEPTNGELYYRLAIQYKQAEEYKKALEYFEKAYKNGYTKDPDLYSNYGLVMFGLRFPEEKVINVFKLGIKENPNAYALYNNLGHCLMRYNSLTQSEAVLKKAIQIDPDQYTAHYCLGFTYIRMGTYDLAIEEEKKCIEILPDYLPGFSLLINAAQHIADWGTIKEYLPKALLVVDRQMKANKIVDWDPFAAAMLPFTNEEFVAIVKSQKIVKWDKNRYTKYNDNSQKNEKIRVGYISPDLTSSHPVGLLIDSIFSFHDRSQFEVFGYGLRDFSDPSALEIQNSFDHYESFAYVDDMSAAKKIHDDGIDILVDLAGHTKDNRRSILSFQPAPIQIQYLGYTASMQCEFIQYHITCKEVISKDLEKYFSEKLIYMPEGNYSTKLRQVKNEGYTRKDYGLPEKDVIFCCFNTVQRVDEALFKIWMNILKAVTGSVLWIYQENDSMQKNLCRYAESMGISAERIHFFKHSLLTDHWHHQVADLWLDTFVLSGGTGGVLCANAGLPVLTLAGDTPQSRIGAGVVTATGNSEMICYSIEEYQEKAIELGRHPKRLAKMKEKLKKNRESMPLFRPDRFIRHLEVGYKAIWERYCNQQDPKTISIEKLPDK